VDVLRYFLIHFATLLFLVGCLENSSSIKEQESEKNNSEISLQVQDVSVVEGNVGSKLVDVKVTFSGPLVASTTLFYTSYSDSASSLQDFTPTFGSLEVAMGETEALIKGIEVLSEGNYENDEKFFLQVTGRDFDMSISKTSGLIEIQNDDSPPSLSIADATGNETSYLEFEVTASKRSEVAIPIDFTTIDIGDASPIIDYYSEPGSLVLLPGRTKTTIKIFAPYDELDEDSESFDIQISSSNSEVNFTRDTATGNILDDNDFPEISFRQSTLDCYEHQGSVSVELELNQISGRDVTVNLNIISNDLSPSEFDNFPSSVTIPKGQKYSSFSFDLNDDSLPELVEQMIIELDSNPTNAKRGVANQLSIDVAESDRLPLNLKNLAEKGLGFTILGQKFKEMQNSYVIGDVDNNGSTDIFMQNLSTSYGDHSYRKFIVWGTQGNRIEDVVLGDSSGSNFSYYANGTGLGEGYWTPHYTGDLDCDGIDDIYFFHGNDSSFIKGSASRPSYSTFNQLAQNEFAIWSQTSSHVFQSLGDLNGDGCMEYSLSLNSYDYGVETGEGRMLLYYNQPGQFSSSYNEDFSSSSFEDAIFSGTVAKPHFGHARFGSQNMGDVNADGYDDLFLSVYNEQSLILFGQESKFTNQDIDGIISNYSTQYFNMNYQSSWQPGSSVYNHGRVIDFNFDGIQDFIFRGGGQSAYAFALGRTGSWPTSSLMSRIDYVAMDAIHFHYDAQSSGDRDLANFADLNADGYIDFIRVLKNDNLDGNSSALLVLWGKEFTPSAIDVDISYDHKIYGEKKSDTISKIETGDFNGDGIEDIMLLGPENTAVSYQEGKTYIIYGNNFNQAVDFWGTGGDENLIGTTSAETFFAGRGNDNIYGMGGADVLQGGAGDDFFYISDYDFKVIKGGPGFDTIRISGYNLDFSSAATAKIQSIEAFDLKHSSAGETLTLSHLAALRLSRKHEIYVQANSNDIINLTGPSSTWSLSSSTTKDSVTYNRYIYSKSNAVIYIEQGATVNLP